MIERLLAAEDALADGRVEVAEQLFAQVAAADPRNAIAITGLAKMAFRRGDLGGAREHVARALEVDPEDAAAQALSTELAGIGATAPVVATEEPRRRGGLIGWLLRLFSGRD